MISGKPISLADFQRFFAVGNGVFVAGQNGDLDFLGERTRGGFVAHHVEQFGARADERDSGFGAGAGEIRVLRKKTVAGMDGIDALFLGHRHDAIDVEIGGDRAFALADEVGFVGFETMDAEAILLCIHGHGAKPEFGARAENTNGDFAAVGSE